MAHDLTISGAARLAGISRQRMLLLVQSGVVNGYWGEVESRRRAGHRKRLVDEYSLREWMALRGGRMRGKDRKPRRVRAQITV